MGQVLELLGWRSVERHGAQLRGPCPVHGSQSPNSRSFSVSLDKHIYQCFASCCTSTGNLLDLYAAATGQHLYEAAFDLCHRLGIEPPLSETREVP
jgi:DNA primase